MYNFSLIIFLIIFNFLSIIFLISLGRNFLLASNYKNIKQITICEEGLIGLIFLAFLSIFINFFIPLSKNITSLVFFTFLFYSFFFEKKIILLNLKKILVISFFSSIVLILSKINTPDAGLYHLPFTQIINDYKIILGSVNLHFRFGTVSNFQYIAAFFNNYLFQENGINIPLAVTFGFFITFLFEKILYFFRIKNNQKFEFHKYIYLFFILLTSLYSFSRYSNYGNDMPAHIYFYFLIYIIIDNKNIRSNEFLFLISLITFFLISNKIFFILTILIPTFFFIKSKNFNFLKTRYFYILAFLALIVFLKNVLISGCVFYPVSFSCFDSLVWTNLNEVIFEASSGEAWSKGWSDQVEISSYQHYSSNFNWLNSWFKVHFKVILEKFGPIILFFLIFFGILFFNNKNNLINSIKIRPIKNFNIVLVISIICFIFWFLKFPLYRYGYCFLILLTYCLFTLNISLIFKKINIKLIKTYTLYVMVLGLVFFTIKNLNRIHNNYNIIYSSYPWPNLTSDHLDDSFPILKKVFIGDNFYIYSKSHCMYSLSPCTHYNKKNLKINNFNTYKVIYTEK